MPKISEQLSLFVKSINDSIIVYSKKRLVGFDFLAYSHWDNTYEMAGYHGLRPILFNAFKNINIPISAKLEINARENIVSNMVSGNEFVRITQLCGLNKINFIPYKGHSFLAGLYNGKQLREIGDLDFMFHPDDARKALELFIKDGYILNPNDQFNTVEKYISIDNVFKSNCAYEATLAKSLNGKLAMIDFHWGFYSSFFPYKVDTKFIFENKTTIKVNNVDCIGPSNKAMFTMLIIHHGGQDAWLKLKFIADLLAFMETKGDKIDWEDMMLELEKMKLKRPALVGFFLLQQYFEYDLPEIVKQSFEKNKINIKLTEPIIDYWENCYNILSLKGRLKYEKILWSIQDEGFNRWKYLKEIFKMYSIPNPIESKRLVTFPENYYFLNGMSKIVTYLYKRGFGKVVR